MEKVNKTEVPHALILNKVFDGAYTEKEGNIAHEIIDFFRADNGKIYFYNNPYGQCPSNLFTEKDYKTSRGKKKNYAAQYMLICSPSKIKKKNEDDSYISQFYIKYVAEIKEILHKESRSKNIKTLEETRDFIKEKIIDKRNIKYGGKKLYSIYKNDTTLLLTFEISKVWEPIRSNVVVGINTKEYRYQRNKGYICSDIHPIDYNNIVELIENKSLWKEINLKKLDNKKFATSYNQKTFLNLIMKTDSEDCYTNILHSVLSMPKMMDKFCKEFAPSTKNAKSFDGCVEREKAVDSGRMDICADNGEQRVVIENKIHSGLNGIREEDKISQLNFYHKWGKEKGYSSPLCFVICPDFRVNEIKTEIADKCPSMSEIFNIIEYSKIAKFIENNKKELEKVEYISKYIDDIINIFKNYSYKDKNEFFEKLFLDAINEA